jgi:hypothetical protein
MTRKSRIDIGCVTGGNQARVGGASAAWPRADATCFGLHEDLDGEGKDRGVVQEARSAGQVRIFQVLVFQVPVIRDLARD